MREQQKRQAALTFLMNLRATAQIPPVTLPIPAMPNSNNGVRCATTYIGQTAYTRCY
jgi:hypothetical protein